MEEQDILVLKSRKLEAINEHVEIDNLPHLFTTRAESEHHNCKVLSQLSPTDKTVVLAIDSVSGNICNYTTTV
jgi:hypothetical protein